MHDTWVQHRKSMASFQREKRSQTCYCNVPIPCQCTHNLALPLICLTWIKQKSSEPVEYHWQQLPSSLSQLRLKTSVPKLPCQSWKTILHKWHANNRQGGLEQWRFPVDHKHCQGQNNCPRASAVGNSCWKQLRKSIISPWYLYRTFHK